MLHLTMAGFVLFKWTFTKIASKQISKAVKRFKSFRIDNDHRDLENNKEKIKVNNNKITKNFENPQSCGI